MKFLKIKKSGSFYSIIYHDTNNNVYIKAVVPIKPKKNNYFYLQEFEAKRFENKPRARKGLANYLLCGLLKELITDNVEYGYLKLTPKSLFELDAGRLDKQDDEGIIHDQGKLEQYYKSLGFKKGKQSEDPEGGQPFAQTIESFLKNCEKFKEKP